MPWIEVVGSHDHLGPRYHQGRGPFTTQESEMQKRLIEEIAKLRGGKTRLKILRVEYGERHEDLINELEEVEAILELIDEETGGKEEETSDQEVSNEATEREPVDSLGE